eukprot:jgi/Psemu1/3030/gm1.3030_g
MAPTAALTGSGGRKAGIANYTKPELENLFRSMRSILQIGLEEWDAIANLHAEKILDNQLAQLLLGHPTQPTQIDEATELTPTSTIGVVSTKKKRAYNRKADNETNLMSVIATALKEGREDQKLQQQALDLHRKLQQQALELELQQQDQADQEGKVLLQALLAQLTSGGGGGATRPPVTPQVTTTADGRLKRKLSNLHLCADGNDSGDDDCFFQEHAIFHSGKSPLDLLHYPFRELSNAGITLTTPHEVWWLSRQFES